MKVFLGAFGDAGHAFPMLALGTALVARGHEVHFETWKRWREDAEAAGIHFADAPEYQVFPTPSAKHLKPYAAASSAISRSWRNRSSLVNANGETPSVPTPASR